MRARSVSVLRWCGQASTRGLGPVAKPVARVLAKISATQGRLVAVGAGCLVACKVLQQQAVADMLSQVILVNPELPGSNYLAKLWESKSINISTSDVVALVDNGTQMPKVSKPTVPIFVHGGGEGGMFYEPANPSWVTGADTRADLNAVFEDVPVSPLEIIVRMAIETVFLDAS